jgi:signal transduction histidine kinase/DNA-binding LacI/PurR family transcriptional regulator/AraC-like DNA-binding protein
MPGTFRNGRPTIGVVAGWQYYWTATPLSYLNPIYQGIRSAAQEQGCNLLLGCGLGPSAAASDPLRPAWPIASPEADFVPIGPWNTTGLIAVCPLHSASRSQDLQQFMHNGHPLVFVGSGETGPTVAADNAGGILAALTHLVEHGHCRIAFIAGSPEDLAGDTGARLNAYHAAVQRFGLAADARLVAYGRHISDGGYRAMQQIMAAGAPFTAVLASNDESAMGALQALKAAGRRIPEEVALIGFDDRPESALQEPALSSVHISLFDMGYRAVTLLLQRIAGEVAPTALVKTATRLICRASCGCGRKEPYTEQKGAATPSVISVAATPEQLVQAMADAVLTATQRSSFTQVYAHCQQLYRTFLQSLTGADDAAFLATLATTLRQSTLDRDDAHGWQAAISQLRHELPTRWPASTQPTLRRQAETLLDQARVAISAAIGQEQQRAISAERWTTERIGRLTAHLLTALDETQVYQVLAHHLPAMGIHTAWVAQFGGENDDPVAWSDLRVISPATGTTSRVASRAFPPSDLLPVDQPFSLALLPLVSPHGQVGFVAFDSGQLDLYGAIAQQVAAALNTARLYRAATEGRRLAEEASQVKSRFLSTVSHELRTPLNLIVGLSGMLLQEEQAENHALPETTRQDIERIHASAQHLGGLIGDVLDLASSEAGQLRLTHDFVDLSQALRMVVETGRQLAQAKGLRWQAQLPATGPWVWGDRTRLRQVALNLVSNAVKFTAEGTVTLTVESGADTVTVQVRDSGLGIPPAEQAAIFTEFHRSTRSVTQGFGGLGLGLAICKRLVELHNGQLGVISTGEEGAGSTFYFTLPTTLAREQPSFATNGDEPRVLILSVQPTDNQELLAHLHRRGLQVEIATPAVDGAWQVQLTVKPPSAVVLDVSHASAESWLALQVIKRNPLTQDVPVLLYTGAGTGGALLQLDYLTKPIAMRELTQALDQHWPADPVNLNHPQRTFLVVDDDPATLDLHARIVQSQAPTNRVLKASNGREALALLVREPVDLVLLDLVMPELDGFDVLEAMRAQPATRSIPVIVVTGQALTTEEMERLHQGVTTVLGKGLYSLEETVAHLEAALERKRKLSSEAQRLVRKAMAYLHEHYSEPITRQDLARHVGMAEDYLTHCFRQELAMTPIAYLTRYRITKAKALLTTTAQSITTIALAVGFADSGYFSRVFRREVGMTPERFRRQA